MAPNLQDYTILVVDANRTFVCFVYGRGGTLLGFLQEDGHYDALCSLPGFFGKSYFCSRCFQAYNDQGQHACPNNEANHCGACLQEEHQNGRRYHCIGTPLGMARSCQSFPGLHGMANLVRTEFTTASLASSLARRTRQTRNHGPRLRTHHCRSPSFTPPKDPTCSKRGRVLNPRHPTHGRRL